MGNQSCFLITFGLLLAVCLSECASVKRCKRYENGECVLEKDEENKTSIGNNKKIELDLKQTLIAFEEKRPKSDSVERADTDTNIKSETHKKKTSKVKDEPKSKETDSEKSTSKQLGSVSKANLKNSAGTEPDWTSINKLLMKIKDLTKDIHNSYEESGKSKGAKDNGFSKTKGIDLKERKEDNGHLKFSSVGVTNPGVKTDIQEISNTKAISTRPTIKDNANSVREGDATEVTDVVSSDSSKTHEIPEVSVNPNGSLADENKAPSEPTIRTDTSQEDSTDDDYLNPDEETVSDDVVEPDVSSGADDDYNIGDDSITPDDDSVDISELGGEEGRADDGKPDVIETDSLGDNTLPIGVVDGSEPNIPDEDDESEGDEGNTLDDDYDDVVGDNDDDGGDVDDGDDDALVDQLFSAREESDSGNERVKRSRYRQPNKYASPDYQGYYSSLNQQADDPYNNANSVSEGDATEVTDVVSSDSSKNTETPEVSVNPDGSLTGENKVPSEPTVRTDTSQEDSTDDDYLNPDEETVSDDVVEPDVSSEDDDDYNIVDDSITPDDDSVDISELGGEEARAHDGKTDVTETDSLEDNTLPIGAVDGSEPNIPDEDDESEGDESNRLDDDYDDVIETDGLGDNTLPIGVVDGSEPNIPDEDDESEGDEGNTLDDDYDDVVGDDDDGGGDVNGGDDDALVDQLFSASEESNPGRERVKRSRYRQTNKYASPNYQGYYNSLNQQADDPYNTKQNTYNTNTNLNYQQGPQRETSSDISNENQGKARPQLQRRYNNLIERLQKLGIYDEDEKSTSEGTRKANSSGKTPTASDKSKPGEKNTTNSTPTQAGKAPAADVAKKGSTTPKPAKGSTQKTTGAIKSPTTPAPKPSENSKSAPTNSQGETSSKGRKVMMPPSREDLLRAGAVLQPKKSIRPWRFDTSKESEEPIEFKEGIPNTEDDLDETRVGQGKENEEVANRRLSNEIGSMASNGLHGRGPGNLKSKTLNSNYLNQGGSQDGMGDKNELFVKPAQVKQYGNLNPGQVKIGTQFRPNSKLVPSIKSYTTRGEKINTIPREEVIVGNANQGMIPNSVQNKAAGMNTGTGVLSNQEGSNPNYSQNMLGNIPSNQYNSYKNGIGSAGNAVIGQTVLKKPKTVSQNTHKHVMQVEISVDGKVFAKKALTKPSRKMSYMTVKVTRDKKPIVDAIYNIPN